MFSSSKFFGTLLLSFALLMVIPSLATDHHVGPGQPLATISEVPWATLLPGDRVFIHWQASPYQEKWVINRQGTLAQPIQVIGVNGPNDEQPVIDGNGAVTAGGLNFWNEERGVIKIGGSNTPPDGLPSHIIIENLEIRSGRPAYSFTNDQGNIQNYASNSASIYVEKAANLTIRNCTLHDSGNGLFIGAFDGQTEHILIEKNHLYDNGIFGSAFEHNAYTSAIDITYQFNHFGPLRAGANGNNLKDRSAGLVVRYNWIESGNRQLDLVDAEDSQVLVNHWRYATTHVYGNILIEPDGAGNSQMVHYGGDSGTLSDYRKGDLYFYNNTCVSTRMGNTTLMRLSTNDETAHVFNNVIYTSEAGNHLAMISGNGTFEMFNNWLRTNWVECHCTPSGTVDDQGLNLDGIDPLFFDLNLQYFWPASGSPLINNASVIPTFLYPDNNVVFEYVQHQDSTTRAEDFDLDIGAYEYMASVGIGTYNNNSDIVLYPNPARNTIHLALTNGTLKQLELFDLQGRIILTAYNNKVDVSSLSKGAYIMKIHFRNGQTNVKRFLKE